MLLGAAYSRAAEREADATAIEILNKAGIRGGPLADLLVRAEERDKIPELISSHPGAKERAEVIRRLAPGPGKRLYRCGLAGPPPRLRVT